MSNYIKCECGHIYIIPNTWPIKCTCGHTIYKNIDNDYNFIPLSLTPDCLCVHRGDSISKVNCGCSGDVNVYKCSIYGRCMIRKVKPSIPEFIIDGNIVKSELSYCNFCKDRTES